MRSERKLHPTMHNNRLSIVIPVFNEADSIPELIKRIRIALSGKYTYELVCVDDGSTDGSFEALKKEKHASETSVVVVRLRRNSGKSAALAEGFAQATGDIIITMDADLQDEPAEIPRLVSEMSHGYDLVVGWRKKRLDSAGKRFVSKIFNSIVGMCTGLQLHDMNSGLKAMTREVSGDIDMYGELHRYVPVLAHAKGYRVTEIPVKHHGRKHGNSKFGIERIFAAFDLVSTLFLSGYGARPFVVFGPPGFLFSLTGLIILTYLSVLRFMGESIGTRPLLLLGVLSFIFGVQLVSTGLLAELVTKTGRSHVRRLASEVIV